MKNIKLPENIGLILTCYNRPDLLKKTLESLEKTIFPEVKKGLILIYDDGSDNFETLALVKEFNPKLPKNWNCIIEINQKNLKIYGVLKTGFEFLIKEGYTILCNLDSDVIIKPFWLFALIRLHNRFPGTVVSGFNGFSKIDKPECRFFDDGYVLKDAAGGINFLFTSETYEKYVKQSFASKLQWDWKVCENIKKSGKFIAVTYPSVVQHTGINSTCSPADKNTAISEDFQLSDPYFIKLPEIIKTEEKPEKNQPPHRIAVGYEKSQRTDILCTLEGRGIEPSEINESSKINIVIFADTSKSGINKQVKEIITNSNFAGIIEKNVNIVLIDNNPKPKKIKGAKILLINELTGMDIFSKIIPNQFFENISIKNINTNKEINSRMLKIAETVEEFNKTDNPSIVEHHNVKSKTFVIAGKMSEIVYKLQIVKKYSDNAILYIDIKDDETKKLYHEVLFPLIEVQEYIADVRFYSGNKSDYDLNNMEISNTKEKWLTVPVGSEKHRYRAIINRTARNHCQSGASWLQLFSSYLPQREKLPSEIAFIGLKEEHGAFQLNFGRRIDYLPTSNLLQAAAAIRSAECFCGNNSVCLAIAIGLGNNNVISEK